MSMTVSFFDNLNIHINSGKLNYKLLIFFIAFV